MVRVLILVALLVALSTLTSLAQETAWGIHVFNPNTGELVRLDLAGNRTTHDLTVDDNTFITNGRIAFSADGSRVAFCAFSYEEAGGQFTLTVRELTTDTLLLAQELPAVEDCYLSSVSLQGDEVALGLIHYYYPDEAPDDTTPIWEVRIVNIQTGAVVQSLGAGTPAVNALELNQQAPLMPEVRLFSADEVVFAQVPWLSAAPSAELSSLQWNRQTDAVSIAPFWGKHSLQHHASTQELIWVEHDPSLPAVSVGALNVVQVRDADGAVRTIYHTSEWVVNAAKYIEGGARVAIHLSAPYDSQAAMTAFPTNRWVALDRSGAVTELMEASPVYSELVAAPDGYIMLAFTYQEDGDTRQPMTSLTYHANGSVTSLWQTDVEYWTVVWTAPVPVLETVTASFPAVSEG